MPRGDVSAVVSHLSDAIVACGVLPLLARFRKLEWQDRPTPAALLACYACFAADESAFGPEERKILNAFNVAHIANVDWWARLVVAVAEPDPSEALLAELAALQATLRLIADTLPHVVPNPAPESVEPGDAVLRILLPAEGDKPSHPMRLSYAIDAVCLLWNVVSERAGSQAALNLLACNPLPDMGISFSGPSAIVADLKALLMQIWERVVVSHSASLEERLGIIPPSLPLMERIGTGTQAALAQRRELEAGVRLFLEAGAAIAEMNDPERFSPARLLQVSASLHATAAAVRGGTRPDTIDDANIEAIVAEERAHLRQALPTQPVWIGKIRVG